MAAYNAATFELPDSPDVTDIEVADINKDGLKDIVMVVKGRGVVRTILNPGELNVPSSAGASALAWTSAATTDKRPPSTPHQVELADVNKDGNLDMIVGTNAKPSLTLARIALPLAGSPTHRVAFPLLTFQLQTAARLRFPHKTWRWRT